VEQFTHSALFRRCCPITESHLTIDVSNLTACCEHLEIWNSCVCPHECEMKSFSNTSLFTVIFKFCTARNCLHSYPLLAKQFHLLHKTTYILVCQRLGKSEPLCGYCCQSNRKLGMRQSPKRTATITGGVTQAPVPPPSTAPRARNTPLQVNPRLYYFQFSPLYPLITT